MQIQTIENEQIVNKNIFLTPHNKNINKSSIVMNIKKPFVGYHEELFHFSKLLFNNRRLNIKSKYSGAQTFKG